MSIINPRSSPFARLKSRGELPHLYKPGGIYFVTFRLFDAVTSRIDPDEKNLEELTPEEVVELCEPPLTLGSCALARPEIGSLVHNAILHFEGARYQLGAWSVMPNHVHVIFGTCNGYTPSQVLQSWKGFTARQANQILQQTGAFWERESFDHLVRNDKALEWFVEYVNNNAVNAGLCSNTSGWPYCSAGCNFAPKLFRC
jgi:REP element-mobilizing transposase RayT